MHRLSQQQQQQHIGHRFVLWLPTTTTSNLRFSYIRHSISWPPIRCARWWCTRWRDRSLVTHGTQAPSSSSSSSSVCSSCSGVEWINWQAAGHRACSLLLFVCCLSLGRPDADQDGPWLLVEWVTRPLYRRRHRFTTAWFDAGRLVLLRPFSVTKLRFVDRVIVQLRRACFRLTWSYLITNHWAVWPDRRLTKYPQKNADLEAQQLPTLTLRRRWRGISLKNPFAFYAPVL